MRGAAFVKRLFLLIVILLFPYFVFADNWTVLRTNKSEYAIGFILQETDFINIQEGEFLMIGNRNNIRRRQLAVIIIPGEKTVSQGIEEAKMLEQIRRNMAFRNNHVWDNYLFLLIPDLNNFPFWIQE